MAEASAPTYGVVESDFGDQYCYMGNDEVLWDWATAPVDPFAGSSTEIPLPEGYVEIEHPRLGTRVLNTGASLPEGVEETDLIGAVKTVTITSGSAMDDKIHVLTCAMDGVKAKELYDAGLPENRILETVSY